MHIYILDLIGVFAFAVFGSYKALEKKFNTYGIVTCAALAALGGGTIRELILRHLPVYFMNHVYLYVTLAASVLAIVLHKHFSKVRRCVLIIDAIGLAAFTFIGARKGSMAGLGLVGMVFFAVLTAVGGGILADIVTGDKPGPFSGELYVFPAAIGGSLYWLIDARRETFISTCIVLLVPFTIRIGWLAQRGELGFLQSPASEFRGLDARRITAAVRQPAPGRHRGLAHQRFRIPPDQAARVTEQRRGMMSATSRTCGNAPGQAPHDADSRLITRSLPAPRNPPARTGSVHSIRETW